MSINIDVAGISHSCRNDMTVIPSIPTNSPNMMLCLAYYINSIVVSGCDKCPLKQIQIMQEILITIQSAGEIPALFQWQALGHTRHVRACASVCWCVQACAKYTHVEVMLYNSTIYLNAHHFEYESNPASMWHQYTTECGLLCYIIVKLNPHSNN